MSILEQNELATKAAFFNQCAADGWTQVGEYLGNKIITKGDEVAIVTDYGKNFAAGPWKISEAQPMQLTPPPATSGHSVTEEG